MKDSKKILFLINPKSGIGSKEDLPDLIKAQTPENFEMEITKTQSKDHAKEICEANRNDLDAIVAIGGDGTVSEVGSHLVGSNCALGIVPSGSGNGLARHLKVPLNIKSAVERIYHFDKKKYDTGTVNDRFFVCAAGFGFDGYIAGIFDEQPKRGFLTYAKLVASSYAAFEPIEFKFELDGKTHVEKSLLCAVANASQFGNGFTISPSSDMQDGQFELVFVEKFPLIGTPVVGTQFFTQSINKSKYWKSFTIKDKLTLEVLNAESYFHLDGEPAKGTKLFNIAIKPGSLYIL
ncbi:YegS/Rv2252/BmrU family lipid kinase [Paracrocinitomix mangrovi]|uniref:diacylglycerol/lipid kinase family protein n=1 Tax=Paracrocinitomix mangrovi TaxID=2862509 RepID=UPI001C8D2789|nr:YegS/Rv2252/BmrU family lipid kinase [Paracrocinitomix mangrovi]UKN02762.1 YegS/Rv2252/BmrU family lipid kinase [Paracrocinitomix mangrovi]